MTSVEPGVENAVEVDFEQLIETRKTPEGYQPEPVEEWWWTKGETGAWSWSLHDWTQQKAWINLVCLKKRTCIHAGGNHGMNARWLSRLFEKVYTFEPDPLNYYCLVKNCESPNIHHYNKGLGSVPGMISLVKSPGAEAKVNTGEIRVKPDVEGKIELATIDSLNLENVDLINLDVEDFEAEVLKGAEFTITRCRPVIMVEDEFGFCDKLLDNMGYIKVDSFVRERLWIPKRMGSVL